MIFIIIRRFTPLWYFAHDDERRWWAPLSLFLFLSFLFALLPYDISLCCRRAPWRDIAAMIFDIFRYADIIIFPAIIYAFIIDMLMIRW